MLGGMCFRPLYALGLTTAQSSQTPQTLPLADVRRVGNGQRRHASKASGPTHWDGRLPGHPTDALTGDQGLIKYAWRCLRSPTRTRMPPMISKPSALKPPSAGSGHPQLRLVRRRRPHRSVLRRRRRHRLSRAGDRQLNYALHVMAITRIQRCLKRRLGDVVYRTILKDMQTSLLAEA